MSGKPEKYQAVEFDVPKVDADGNPISKSEQKRMIKGTYSTFKPVTNFYTSDDPVFESY